MRNIFNILICLSLIILVSGCEKRVGHFVKTGELNQPRSSHAATLLKDGNVLITGGRYQWNILNSSEIYITKEGRFIKAGNMLKKRYGHVAIGIPDGRVVVLGGTSPVDDPNNAYDERGHLYSDALTSDVIEIYNPKTNKFEYGGRLKQKVSQPHAVLMRDGRIFIYGGKKRRGYFSGRSEIYDPKSKTSKLTTQINYFRGSPAITVLKDGKILITGGVVNPDRTTGKLNHTIKPFKVKGIKYDIIGGPTKTAEIYDPKTDTYKLINNMQYPRDSHCASLLPDGNVLLVGGAKSNRYGSFLDKNIYKKNIHNKVKRSYSYGDRKGDLQDIELFNPKTNKFKIVGKLNYALRAHRLNLINNKYILATGGIGKTEEVIDLKDFKTYPTKSMVEKRGGTATNINKNRVLVVGGYFYNNIKKNTAEIFELR